MTSSGVELLPGRLEMLCHDIVGAGRDNLVQKVVERPATKSALVWTKRVAALVRTGKKERMDE